MLFTPMAKICAVSILKSLRLKNKILSHTKRLGEVFFFFKSWRPSSVCSEYSRSWTLLSVYILQWVWQCQREMNAADSPLLHPEKLPSLQQLNINYVSERAKPSMYQRTLSVKQLVWWMQEAENVRFEEKTAGREWPLWFFIRPLSTWSQE